MNLRSTTNKVLIYFVCLSPVFMIGMTNAQTTIETSEEEVIHAPALAQEVFGESRSLTYYSLRDYGSMIDELQQTVSIDFRNKPVRNALDELAEHAGFGIAYSSDWEVMNQRVSLALDDVTVVKGLELVLADTGYEAAISSRREIIFVRQPEALSEPEEVQETGGIAGRIIDQTTGEELPGTNVLIMDTNIGTSTDESGEFELQNIPEGEYVLLIHYLGYSAKEIEITIVAGETLQRDIRIRPDILEGEEVVLQTQALGQARAIQQQRTSSSIVNVVSEARLRELADANAAESVGRLPGVSIVRDGGEARNVAIRGMSSRYNNITFDGVRMPSTDFGGRSVDLNFISQEMLSGIELYKTNRPDLDADAIGGTVNFNLTRIPEETTTRLNLKGGYSGHINEFSNYGASISSSSRFFDNRLGVAGSLDIESNDRSSDELQNSYSVLRPAQAGEDFAPLETNSMITSITSETRERMGGSLMLDYEIPNGTIYLSGFGSRLNRDQGQLRRRLAFIENRQDWHFQTREIEVDVFSLRLSGEHLIPALGNAEVEWRASRSTSNRSHPFDHNTDFHERSGFSSDLDRRGPVEELASFAHNDFRNTELRRSDLVEQEASETDMIGQLDITMPYALSSNLYGNFKFGGKLFNKDRNRTYERLRLFMADQSDDELMAAEDREMVATDQGHISMFNYVDEGFERDNLFFGSFGAPIGLDRNLINTIPELHLRFYDRDLGAPINNQGGNELITAAYVMTELNIGSRLLFIPGVRYEHTNGDYEAMHGRIAGTNNHIGWLADTTATQSFDQWFPMAQLRYQMTDWMQVRASATRSSSRPNYAEIVPRQAIHPQSRNINRGNPGLKPSVAHNYDLAFTFYGNRLGLLAIGGFYKEISDLIFNRSQRVLDDYEELGLSINERNYLLDWPVNNPFDTSVRGVEIEWQNNFTHLPSPFNGLVINANITAMDTETQYPRSEAVRTAEGVVRVDTFRVGQKLDQPELIANLSVGYDYGGFSVRVTMLYQGEQLFAVGRRLEFDRHTESILRWDAVIRQRLMGDLMSVYLNLNNITNQPDSAILFSNAFPTRRQYFGQTFDLGVRVNF